MHGVHAAASSSASPPMRSLKAPPRSWRRSRPRRPCGAARDDLAAIDDQEVVIGLDLVEQMCGPQHADIVALGKLMHMADDGSPRRMIEPDGGLIEEEQFRTVQEGRAISTRRR